MPKIASDGYKTAQLAHPLTVMCDSRLQVTNRVGHDFDDHDIDENDDVGKGSVT